MHRPRPDLRAVLRTLAERYVEWLAGAGPAAAGVRGGLRHDRAAGAGPAPDGGGLIGTATGLDDSGRLVVRTADGDVPISAGDVTRLTYGDDRMNLTRSRWVERRDAGRRVRHA